MRPEEESQGPVIRDRRRIDPATGQVRDNKDAGAQRGPAPAGGQHRPGRHSVSRPGGAAAAASSGAGEAPGSANGGSSPAGPGRATAGGTSAAGSPADAGTAAAGTTGGGAAGEGRGEGADSAAQQTRVMLAERTADLQRLQAEYANYRKRVERDRIAVREQALANVLHALLPVLDDIGRAREHGELTGGFKSVGESLEGIAVKLGLTSFGESGDPFDPTLHEALMHSYSTDVTEPTAVQILQPGYKVGERIIRPARVAVAEPADGAEGSGGSSEGTPGGHAETGGSETGDAQPGAEAADDPGASGTSKE
jgi:molecular chaperone GrpE